MAVTFTGAGVAGAASGASPQAVTTATSFAVGDYLVVLMAYDNSGGGGADPMTGTVAVSGGYTGASVSAQTGHNDPGTASSGLAARCVCFPVTTAIPSSTAINVSWSGTVVVRAVAFMKVSSAAVTSYRTQSGATGGNTVAATASTALVTPSVTNGEGVLCWVGHENGAAVTGDADTTNGSWSAVYGTFSGSGATGMAAYFQSKVVTATATQSFSASGTSSDWITGCLIFTETPLPAITQAAYRIYDDGTEAGAVALAAQDTAAQGDITLGDGIGQLRVRLQSTNAGIINATDDFQLQWEKNASGSWTNVGTGDVLGHASANITEGQATTNRLGAGTGTFVAGKAAEDGLVDNHSWSSNNYTELLYTVTIVKANVTAGDVIRFRVLRNGSTTGMTYTQVPTVNVVTLTVTQASYRFYSDGTESGSTALAAQDTAPSYDPNGGDLALQLRMRLQSTSAQTVPATADWQLQYEKNSSGTWVNVGLTEALCDEYAESNQDNVQLLYGGSVTATGESFLGNGGQLSKASFYMGKSGSPSGNVQAELYDHTGTVGSTGVPNALNKSSTAKDATAITTAIHWEDFAFDGTFTLENGTPYFIVLNANAVGNVSNFLTVGIDTTTSSAFGNGANYSGSWSSSAVDRIFRVYSGTAGAVVAYDSANLTDAAATTNRLGSGSGSFVAGKVSEDALADDVGWSGNNFTELLYSIQLKAADLTSGDTLRFRVLYSGANALTYTQVPEVTVSAEPVSATATPGFVAGTATAFAPTLHVSESATVVTDVASGSAVTPAVSIAVGVSTSAIPQTGQAYVPTIFVEQSATVTAAALEGTSTAYAPTVQTAIIVQAGVVVGGLPAGGAPITHDASSQAAGSSTSSLTWSHTIGSGSNRKLFVVAGAEHQTGQIPGTPTYNSVAMHLAVSSDEVQGPEAVNYATAHIWYLDDSELPAAGTYTIVVPWSVGYRFFAGATSLSGIAQGAPEATAKSTVPNGTAVITTNITASVNAWIISAVGTTGGGNWTPTSPLVERQDQTGGGGSFVHGTQPATSGSNAVEWTGVQTQPKSQALASWAATGSGGAGGVPVPTIVTATNTVAVADVVAGSGTTYAPTVVGEQSATATPAVVVSTGAVQATTGSGSAATTASLVAGTGTTYAPTRLAASSASPSVVAATSVCHAPSAVVQSSASASPVVLTRTGVVVAPSFQTSPTALASVLASTSVLLSPTILVGSDTTVTVKVGQLSVTYGGAVVNYVGQEVYVEGVVTEGDIALPIGAVFVTGASATATPPVVAATGITLAPTRTAASAASAVCLLGSAVVLAPTIQSQSSTSVTPAVLVRTSTVFAPALLAASAVTSASLTRTSALHAPALLAASAVTSPALARTSALYVPVLSAAPVATVAAPIAATGTVLVPTLSTASTGGVTAGVALGTGTVVAPMPFVVMSRTVTAALITSTGSVPSVTVSASQTIVSSSLVGTGDTYTPAPLTGSAVVISAPVAVSIGTTFAVAFSTSSTLMPAMIRGYAAGDTTYSPSSLSGLTVWIDASQLGLAHGAVVSQWDNYGSGGEGVVFGSPAPVFQTNALNGHPSVKFTAYQGRITGTGMVVDGSFDMTLMYVGRMWGSTKGRIFSGQYPAFNYLFGTHGSGGEPVAYDNDWLAGPFTGGALWPAIPSPWRRYEAVCSDSPRLSSFYVDGALHGTTTQSSGHSSGWNISGFNATPTGESADCEVTELVALNVPIYGRDRMQLEGYFGTKYGFATMPLATGSVSVSAFPPVVIASSTTYDPSFTYTSTVTAVPAVATGMTYAATIAVVSSGGVTASSITAVSTRIVPTLFVAASSSVTPAVSARMGTTSVPVVSLVSTIVVNAPAIARTSTTLAPAALAESIARPVEVARSSATPDPSIQSGQTTSVGVDALSGTATALAPTPVVALTVTTATVVATSARYAPAPIGIQTIVVVPSVLNRTSAKFVPTFKVTSVVAPAPAVSGLAVFPASTIDSDDQVFFNFTPGVVSFRFAGTGGGQVIVNTGKITAPRAARFSVIHPPTVTVISTVSPQGVVASGTHRFPAITHGSSPLPVTLTGLGYVAPVLLDGSAETGVLIYLIAPSTMIQPVMRITCVIVLAKEHVSTGEAFVPEPIPRMDKYGFDVDCPAGVGATFAPTILSGNIMLPATLVGTSTKNVPTFTRTAAATPATAVRTSVRLVPVIAHSGKVLTIITIARTSQFYPTVGFASWETNPFCHGGFGQTFIPTLREISHDYLVGQEVREVIEISRPDEVFVGVATRPGGSGELTRAEQEHGTHRRPIAVSEVSRGAGAVSTVRRPKPGAGTRRRGEVTEVTRRPGKGESTR